MWRLFGVLLLVVNDVSAACPVWPLVIAHRGASGDYPEHTAIAYWQAMQQGADFIEADLVPTKDGVLISRHENELSQSTNVATISQFANRKSKKVVDGLAVEGWFAEDFTLAEIRMLRARESKPELRPDSAAHNDHYPLVTLAEIIELVERFEQQSGRRVGLYLETKHPTYFRVEGRHQDGKLINQDTSVMLLQQLAQWQRQADYPVYIQSFEISNLWWIRQQGLKQYRVSAALIQLLGDISGNSLYPASNFAEPWDLVGQTAAEARKINPVLQLPAFHYGKLLTSEGQQFLQSYADGIGPWKEQWFSPNQPQRLLFLQSKSPLKVHPYTFRAEKTFLPSGVTDLNTELRQVFQQGIDGVFTDFTAIAVQSRAQTCVL
ncbi:glycerophosphodiester phosphodiesterase family protein [Rheinheimera texasensis]|uniref:glycerophosphodiester phosphodiesterase family protein n=1 Tax=Rheinheimera texasensis TaxID=306205 RepID=UPI00068DD26C|nr:glycerophosphodiester phosphodiesterase family protein [Rheinheimera texasensis]